MHWFPVAAVTNYCTHSSLEQHIFTFLWFWKLEIQHPFHWAKAKEWAGLHFLRRPQGASISLPFPASRDSHIPGLLALTPPSKPAALHPTAVVTWLPPEGLVSLCPSHKEAVTTYGAHTADGDALPISRPLITAAKSLLPCELTVPVSKDRDLISLGSSLPQPWTPVPQPHDVVNPPPVSQKACSGITVPQMLHRPPRVSLLPGSCPTISSLSRYFSDTSTQRSPLLSLLHFLAVLGGRVSPTPTGNRCASYSFCAEMAAGGNLFPSESLQG